MTYGGAAGKIFHYSGSSEKPAIFYSRTTISAYYHGLRQRAPKNKKKKVKQKLNKYSQQTATVTIMIDQPKRSYARNWDYGKTPCYICRVFGLGKDDLNRDTIWALSQRPTFNGIDFLNYTKGSLGFENMGQRKQGLNHENAPYIQFPVALLGDAKLTNCKHLD